MKCGHKGCESTSFIINEPAASKLRFTEDGPVLKKDEGTRNYSIRCAACKRRPMRSKYDRIRETYIALKEGVDEENTGDHSSPGDGGPDSGPNPVVDYMELIGSTDPGE